MARISFRQGIVRHQTDTNFNPTFLDLTGEYISLVVSPDPTLIAFAHGDADYLYTEKVSVSDAWGPIPKTGVDVWIYWDLNLADGGLSRDFTLLEPIVSAVEPSNPAKGQMWFDKSENKWFERKGNRWIEVVRVFAALIYGGTILRSMSLNNPKFTGTQVGLTNRTRAGSLVYGKNNKALRNTGTNQFFTTEDDFLTGVPTSASQRLNTVLITGEAISPLAAYQIVEYNDYNKITAANPAMEGRRLFGIIEEDAHLGDVVNFVTEGIIASDDWDWIGSGANVNDPLYIDATGQLTRLNPMRQKLPVAIIIGQQEIFFAPRLFMSIDSTATSSESLSAAQEEQLNTATQLAVANQNTLNGLLNTQIPALQLDAGSALAIAEEAKTTAEAAVDASDDSVSKEGDTMVGPLLGPMTTSSDVPETLTTKGYVQGLLLGYQSTFTIDMWTGTEPRTLFLPQSIHGLPLNTLYHVTVKDASTNKIIGVDVEVDEATGLIKVLTNGSAFAGIIRIT